MATGKRLTKTRKGRTGWKRIARLSDAGIERMAARGTDNPATKKADWAKSFIGAPPLKTPVNAKFDVDVVDWFKTQGRVVKAGWMRSCAATWKCIARRGER